MTHPRPRKQKTSLAARRLIRSALRGRTQRQAARLLHLPNQAQLRRMLTGEIADTPAMRAALARARARAPRAFYFVRSDSYSVLLADVDQRLGHVTDELLVIKALLASICAGHGDEPRP